MNDALELLELDFNQFMEDFYNATSDAERKEYMNVLLRAIVYAGFDKQNNPEGFLHKVGELKSLIDTHNNKSYKYKNNSGKSVDIFGNCDATNYNNPLRIEPLETPDKPRIHHGGRVLSEELENEFLEDTLENSSNIEIAAKCMHWVNKVAKYIDSIVESKFGEAESNKKETFSKLYMQVTTDGVSANYSIPEYWRDFYDYSESEDQEIKKYMIKDLGEDAGNQRFEAYKKVRRTIKQKLNNDPKFKNVNFDEFMEFLHHRSIRALAYSIKNICCQELMYQIESSDSKNVMHYLREDTEKAREDNMYKYVYGAIIAGYKEPFEIHVNSTQVGLDGIIEFVEERLKENGINKKVVLPMINRNVFVKTGIPYKLTSAHRSELRNILSDSSVIAESASVSNVENTDNLYDPKQKNYMSPVYGVLKQSVACLSYISSLHEIYPKVYFDGKERDEKELDDKDSI